MTETQPGASGTSRHHLGGDRSLGFGVLSVSDTHTEHDDPSGHLARELITGAGHKVAQYALVGNSIADIREKLEAWLPQPSVECAITVGGTGVSSRDLSVNTLEVIGGKKLDGFGELYRSLSYAEVGPLAMISRAGLYLVHGKPVYALPGSERAVRTAFEKLILPATIHLVEELER